MKILSIGNTDINEALVYLPEFAKADNQELVLGSIYCENASLEDHYRNYIDENEVYKYDVYDPNEEEILTTENIAIYDAVEDDEWEAIILCNDLLSSGDKESYEPYLSELCGYCKLVNPDVKIYLVQNWEIQECCSLHCHHNNPTYSEITETCAEALITSEADDIIPCGKAMATAETTNLKGKLIIGNSLEDTGKFLISSTIYEKIFKAGISENKFFLKEFDKSISDLLKICAHIAVKEGIMI